MTVQNAQKRTVLLADLRPLMGQRFQPTGFPDLGAAEFDSGDIRCLLVESAQSMANRLEATTWDDSQADQVSALAGLPYVRVVDAPGAFLTSSRVEAHRLACAYIMEGSVNSTTGEKWLEERFGLRKGYPLDNRAVARACFALDPLSLVHGVFFARKPWPWQPKVARAVTGFIEAYGVRPAVSGGVKRDSVHNVAETGRGSSEGFGSVPYHRVEYTADRILASFSIDHAQLRSYGLSEAGTALLGALIDFELGTLLNGGLRLRTACDLQVVTVEGTQPDADEAAKRIATLIPACGAELGPITTVTWGGAKKEKS